VKRGGARPSSDVLHAQARELAKHGGAGAGGLARQCLERRLPTLDAVACEVAPLHLRLTGDEAS